MHIVLVMIYKDVQPLPMRLDREDCQHLLADFDQDMLCVCVCVYTYVACVSVWGASYFFNYYFILSHGLSVCPWLIWDSLCRSHWPQTSWDLPASAPKDTVVSLLTWGWKTHAHHCSYVKTDSPLPPCVSLGLNSGHLNDNALFPEPCYPPQSVHPVTKCPQRSLSESLLITT